MLVVNTVNTQVIYMKVLALNKFLVKQKTYA